MKTKTTLIVASYLIVALILSFCFTSMFKSDLNKTHILKIESGLENQHVSTYFDYYEEKQSEGVTQISATKNVLGTELQGITNVNINENVSYHTAYDVNYDTDAEVISLVVSVFDQEENLVSVKVSTAYPIYYSDGTFDALFDIDDKNVYLSEILNDSNEECFFFSFAMSLLTAKIVSAVIVATKVAVAVTATVVLAGVTYQVAQLTKAKIKEREKVVTKEWPKKNPKVYYPTTRKSGKLLISASAVGLSFASKQILLGKDFWSPFDYTAKKLAITASGGYFGPEIDSNKDGYYWHYHLKAKIGGHSFYGAPKGGVY